MRTFKIVAALITVGAWATAASATLVLDVELSSGAKAATVTANQSLTLNIYAKVVGGNSTYTDDGFQTLNASFKSTGTLLVDFTGATNGPEPFVAVNGSQTGASTTGIDSDGDTDWGSNNAGAATGWFIARGGSSPVAWTDANHPAKFLVGTLSITVKSSATVGQTADLNAIIRAKSGVTNYYYWKEDGASKSSNGLTNVSVDDPVTLTVIPEPATMALLALGGLGVLLRRNRRS